MTDKDENEKLTPEEARDLIKSIEDVEREESNEQDKQRPK